MVVQITLPTPRRVVPWLLAAVGFLVVAGLGTQIARYELGHGELLGLVYLFDLDQEANLPTWFSSMDLLVAGVVLGAIAVAKRRARDRFASNWTVLAAVFLAMSVDEVAVIHEIAIDPVKNALHVDGALRFAWVIPGALFTLGFAAYMLRFLWSLPTRTRMAFIGAGCVFVGGALGVEMLSGAWVTAYGEENVGYNVIVTLEESMEMLGIVAFIAALLDYAHWELAHSVVSLDARVRSDVERSSPVASGQVLRPTARVWGAPRPTEKARAQSPSSTKPS